MKCALCNGFISMVIGKIPFESKTLGNIFIPNIKQSICQACGDITIDYHESEKIHTFLEEKEAEAICSLPIGGFISLNKAAQILGITKQAFSKNSRIKRGFIYSTILDGRRVYYKLSVEEFKRTGNKDGRISLLTSFHERLRKPAINPFIPPLRRTHPKKYSILQPRALTTAKFHDTDYKPKTKEYKTN